MKYDEKSGIITVSVREFADISRRCISPVTPFLNDEDAKDAGRIDTDAAIGERTRRELVLSAEIGGILSEIRGTPDDITGSVITLVRKGAVRGGKPTKDLCSAVRGELFIYGHLLCVLDSLDSVTLTACYINDKTGEIIKESETRDRATLEKFFDKCRGTLAVYALPERDRVTKRLLSMRSVKFPFDTVRDGQSELIRAVYRSLAKGNTLFAEAPTGTGKTVSVIYPAIRALGDGRCDKVFYLTPKATIANAAKECLISLAERGSIIRAVRLLAKEKICPHRLICKEKGGKCPLEKNKAMPDAVLALYNLEKTVIDKEDILDESIRYSVCPHELSLCYSEICDFILCDLNYVFDPVVYLRRYFDRGGRYALLVDEAHNLEGRAREMYSADISTRERDSLTEDPLFGMGSSLFSPLREVSDALRALLLPYLKDDARRNENGEEISAAHLSDVPSELYTIVSNIEAITERELYRAYAASDEQAPMRVKKIKDLYYKATKLSSILDRFSDGYRLLLFLNGKEISIKLLCIDTGEVLKEKMRNIGGVVFFSATLEPCSYYMRVLGGDGSADFISVRSPFSPESLSVTIMDKISTRYSERERTLGAVSRVIAATMSSKRGHYMVFSPSFEYSEALFRAFSSKYPKIKSILQSKDMTESEREQFLDSFRQDDGSYLVGFAVMGGIYSEGIDLSGDSLIGAVIVGIGMPSLSYEREAIADYYQDKLDEGKQYAYIYPGMNKVFQAAGRVIRREDDKGVIVLIDDRFADPIYKKSIPALWRGMQYSPDAKDLNEILVKFWKEREGEAERNKKS